jgi:hypothetical protein
VFSFTPNFNGFFRHPRHFEMAAKHRLRSARQRGKVRLWSAASATELVRSHIEEVRNAREAGENVLRLTKHLGNLAVPN